MSCAEQRLVEFVGAGEIEGKYWDRLIIVADCTNSMLGTAPSAASQLLAPSLPHHHNA